MVGSHAIHAQATPLCSCAAWILVLLSGVSHTYAERLAAQFHTRGWFSKHQSFGIARKLDAFVDGVSSLSTPGQYAQAHARLRAFLTVVIGSWRWWTTRLGVSATAFETASRSIWRCRSTPLASTPGCSSTICSRC